MTAISKFDNLMHSAVELSLTQTARYGFAGNGQWKRTGFQPIKATRRAALLRRSPLGMRTAAAKKVTYTEVVETAPSMPVSEIAQR